MYLILFIILCIAIYYFKYPKRDELDVFIDSIQSYRQYNPQQYDLFLEKIKSREVLNVFHDFVMTLPVNMLSEHRRKMHQLRVIVGDKDDDLHDGFQNYTYRYYME